MGKRRLSNPDEIADRLVLTRLALGHANATQYAKDAQLNPKQYNNFERGYRPSIDAAAALCEAYNLTLDWIYFGEDAALPGAILDKIRQYRRGSIAAKEGRPFRRA